MRVVDVYTLPGVVSVQMLCEHVGIARYHGDGPGYGSPYAFSVTFRLAGEDVEFFAAHASPYTREIARSVHQAMRALGMKRIRYERKRTTHHANIIRL